MKTYRFLAFLLFHGLCVNTTFMMAQEIRLKPAAALIQHYHQSHVSFAQPQLFKPSTESGSELKPVLTAVTMLDIDNSKLQTLVTTANGAIELRIPFRTGVLALELVKVNLFTEDFKVETDRSNGEDVGVDHGIHYRGIIKGDNNSLAVFSFFKDDVIGLVYSNAENIVVGKLRKRTKNQYVAYSDKDLLVSGSTDCHTIDDPTYAGQLLNYVQNGSGLRSENCVRFYYELDYDIFENSEQDVQQATNWITAVHNNVSTLYDNDQITTALSGIYIWTTEDPYHGSSATSQLTKFKEQRPFFNGDLAQLVSMETGGFGGLASGINTFCNNGMRFSYSDVDYEYNSVPIYSWTINVITHEFGHLMGSYHTHNCIWPGGAIDDCGPIAGFPNEGVCPLGPDPVGGGTIMSYCHLTNFGINFNKGFGILPATAIHGAVDDASCLTSSCAPNTPAYCPSEGKTSGEWIESVSLGEFDNVSGQGPGYSDFTNQLIYLAPGSTVTVTLCPGYSGTHYEENFSVWLDLNQDLDFGDPGEIVFQATDVDEPVTGSFTIPPGLSGGTRMRISMKFDTLAGPCEFFKYGEVEDYSISFTPIATYCPSFANQADDEWIDYVELGNLQRTSESDDGYFDGTGLTATLLQNSTGTITYSAGMVGFDKNEYWKVWIDFNHDGDFDDANEKILARHSKNKGMLTKTFSVPGSAIIGKTRMRVSMKRNSGPESCETFTHGEVEDYSVGIIPQAVAPPTAALFTFRLYPNPAASQVTAEWEQDIASGKAELMDVTGRILMRKNIGNNGQAVLFDISDLVPGVYFVRLMAGDESIGIEKMIKE